MWGRLIPIQFIKYVIPDNEGRLGSNYHMLIQKAWWEFNDAVKGRIATSVVIGINISDEEQFLSVADEAQNRAKFSILKNSTKWINHKKHI